MFGLLLVFGFGSALLAIYLIYTSVRSYWRLRHFKGPKLAAWTDWQYVWWSQTGHAHLIWSELIDQYGMSSLEIAKAC